MDLLSIDKGMFWWTLISFVILVSILGKFAWKPLLSAIDEREKKIDDAINDAKNAKEESERILAEHKQILSESEHKAAEMIKNAKQIANKQVEDAKVIAKEEAAKLVEQAKRDIENQMNTALNSLKGEIADLTILATKKLIKENLDDKKNKDLINQYLDDISKKN